MNIIHHIQTTMLDEPYDVLRMPASMCGDFRDLTLKEFKEKHGKQKLKYARELLKAQTDQLDEMVRLRAENNKLTASYHSCPLDALEPARRQLAANQSRIYEIILGLEMFESEADKKRAEFQSAFDKIKNIKTRREGNANAKFAVNRLDPVSAAREITAPGSKNFAVVLTKREIDKALKTGQGINFIASTLAVSPQHAEQVVDEALRRVTSIEDVYGNTHPQYEHDTAAYRAIAMQVVRHAPDTMTPDRIKAHTARNELLDDTDHRKLPNREIIERMWRVSQAHRDAIVEAISAVKEITLERPHSYPKTHLRILGKMLKVELYPEELLRPARPARRQANEAGANAKPKVG